SCVALKEIAREVVGTDASTQMLALAPRDAGVRYVQANAENLPLHDGSFELITVSMAFHWFDRARFLAEARRVLRPSSWLVIYDNWFNGVMKENTGFEGWHRDEYLGRYPAPPCDRRPLSEADARGHGFSLAGQETYTNDVSFSAEELAGYLTTQSNVIAAVEEVRESAEVAYWWLAGSLTPLFAEPRGTFTFGGVIRYLERMI
ncbi:MAG: class I SAM-dependent methyltransferase, partial [Pyrinomonadaceae bacterium]